MIIFSIICCLAILIVLIAVLKFHPFLAFIIVSFLLGWWLGLPVEKLTASVKTGIGNILGDLVVIICLGAMLGKLVAETGAAQQISGTLVKAFGEKRLQWAMMLTGIIVGIPLFYNVGFVLLIPLLFAVIYQTGKPAVYMALPMLAALSVTHGFLPPHPSPVAIAAQMNASLGRVLLYGMAVAIPAILLAGPVFAVTIKKIKAVPLQIFNPKTVEPEKMPGAVNSFFTALLPALLLIFFSVVTYLVQAGDSFKSMLAFWGDPMVVMLVSLLYGTYSLGIKNGHSIKTIMDLYASAISEIAIILLVIAGAGALKQVMVDSGVSAQIGNQLSHVPVNPLVLGWLMAVVIRLCVGSATVAGLTAAGIMAPVLLQSNVNAELMVLSIGAGSLFFSHVNDSGFWMFKEYFNLSVKDTLRTWSVMETIVSVVGLAGVLVLQWLLF
jgi:Gnt-I system high-affinity gluconate transporter